VDNWRSKSDPVGALETLQMAAPQGMGAIFAMLSSELAMAMNDVEEPK
jgi:hypothetical protein